MSEAQINLPPFQSPSEHWFAKLRTTPLGEALRGQLTGSLDERRAIAAAELPAPLDALVDEVVRRARLWPAERRDVARELIAHFQDGLESGVAAEELRRRFGDFVQAARLIRRAKLRNRAWPWQVWRRSWQALGIACATAIVGYGLLALRYSLGRPTITRNYAAELNDAHQAIACEERAWPAYRAALLQMQPPPADAWWPRQSTALPPTAAQWETLAAYVQVNAAALPELQRAAGYSRLGFVWGDAADDELFAQREMQHHLTQQSEPVVTMLLPQAQLLREVAHLLAAAAALAQRKGDADAYLAHATALVALAEQVRAENGPLVEGLVSLAIYATALQTLGETLADRPDLLDADAWVDLAHRTAAYAGGGAFRLNMDFERQMFADIMQRCFTDDGHGDGRLTPQGFTLLTSLSSSNFSLASSTPWTDHVAGPGMSALVASRSELTQLADAFFNSMQASTSGPRWTWQPAQAADPLQELNADTLDRLRYFPLLLLLPAYESAAAAAENACQRRDAVLTAIALELFRREHGAWPTDLATLVPRYMPALPPDRFTGDPLGYRMIDGRPLLYSRGADRLDDGGQPPTDPLVHPEWAVAHVQLGQPRFDWVLWPPAAARGSEAPPTEAPPTEAPPTEAPPTEAPPAEAPPTEAPPTEAPPTESPPAASPSVEAPPAESLPGAD